MTVGELIEQLKDLDPTLEVYTTVYEGGYDDLNKIDRIDVCRDFYKDDDLSWWHGDHEEFNVVRKSPANPFSYDIVKGIVISK